MELIEDTGDTYHGLSSSLMRAVSDEINGNGQVLTFHQPTGLFSGSRLPKMSSSVNVSQLQHPPTWHKRKDRLMCHWCNSDTAVPPHCPNCGGLTAPVGAGTERIEHALRRLFPKTKVTRLDSDSLGGGDFAKWRDEIANGKRRLLVGTPHYRQRPQPAAPLSHRHFEHRQRAVFIRLSRRRAFADNDFTNHRARHQKPRGLSHHGANRAQSTSVLTKICYRRT